MWHLEAFANAANYRPVMKYAIKVAAYDCQQTCIRLHERGYNGGVALSEQWFKRQDQRNKSKYADKI